MSYWGKVFGGMAGFVMGGPVGALFGAALGHAADAGKLDGVAGGFAGFASRVMPFDPLRVASALGRREQVFGVAITVLAAKLCKCDGPVTVVEIEAFKRILDVSEGDMAGVARLFNSAREDPEGFEPYAIQLGQTFSDERSVLERVLAGLYQIAAADGPINSAEGAFLSRVSYLFGLGENAGRRAGREMPPPRDAADSPYVILGVSARASADEIRTRWKVLVREHHPDRVAARGASSEMVRQASEKVARINAAYDLLKRERGF